MNALQGSLRDHARGFEHLMRPSQERMFTSFQEVVMIKQWITVIVAIACLCVARASDSRLPMTISIRARRSA